MAVKGRELENQERGMSLTTREAAPTTPPDDELQVIRRRIESARSIQPKGAHLHCGDCFKNGRDAAIRMILGEEGA